MKTVPGKPSQCSSVFSEEALERERPRVRKATTSSREKTQDLLFMENNVNLGTLTTTIQVFSMARDTTRMEPRESMTANLVSHLLASLARTIHRSVSQAREPPGRKVMAHLLHPEKDGQRMRHLNLMIKNICRYKIKSHGKTVHGIQAGGHSLVWTNKPHQIQRLDIQGYASHHGWPHQ